MPKPPAAFSPLMIDEIERIAAAQAGQRLDDRLAAGAADDIAEKQQTHSGSRAAQRA